MKFTGRARVAREFKFQTFSNSSNSKHINQPTINKLKTLFFNKKNTIIIYLSSILSYYQLLKMDSFSKNSDFNQTLFRNGQYSALIQKLINQINNIVHHLLGYITTVYQFHGINFSVLHYQSQLLRMLIPYEIFDNFRFKDQNDIVSQKYPFTQSRIPNDTFSIPIFNQNYFPNLKKTAFPEEKINAQKRDLNNNNNINQLEQSVAQKIGAIDNDYQISNPRKRNYKLSCGGRPILEPYQQQQVKKFIHSEAMKGNLLTMQIIGSEARKIAKGNENFLGSIGWVKNFFKRFPKMKQYYNHAKNVRASHYGQVFRPKSNYNDSNYNNNYMNEYKRRPSQEQQYQYPKINAKDNQQQYLEEEGQKIYTQSEQINQGQQQYNSEEQNQYQNERGRKRANLKSEHGDEDQERRKQIQKQEKKPNEELSSYQFKKIPSKTYKLKTSKPYI